LQVLQINIENEANMLQMVFTFRIY